MDLLVKQYEEEAKADRFFEASEDVNYLKEFQEFERPPVVPEEVAQTEFFRPNPAAFQKRINDNPYAVDVGFASLENPIYSRLDNYPALLNTRANTQHYNPAYEKPVAYESGKPFASKLNAVLVDKLSEADGRGKLNELIAKAGMMNFNSTAVGFKPTNYSKERSYQYSSMYPNPIDGQVQHAQYSNTNPEFVQSNYQSMFDMIRQADNVVIFYSAIST